MDRQSLSRQIQMASQSPAYANYLADEMGVDTISVGSVIAFTMDCLEQGIISPDDVDGLDCRFGNQDPVFTLIQKIARREGVGDLLARFTPGRTSGGDAAARGE